MLSGIWTTIADPDVRADTRQRLGLVEAPQAIVETSPPVQPRLVQENQPEWSTEPLEAKTSPPGTLTFTAVAEQHLALNPGVLYAEETEDHPVPGQSPVE
ncbi:hypothetical protein [Deinococcus sp. QL22]|uniref:hypothetical protein n=1 Tax=Deinococcus sp. QL22 TaxID=2939437 RepID=UPI002016CA05|nr:hypothetical protein [Deinococcus sp. QL22]UQN08618.1 hypothetical protein M1R55_21045 [Deinococcus sp. QL22]